MESEPIEQRRPKTKIPKLKFRQAAERVRAERIKALENNQYVSHIPTPRTSISKLSRGSKIPPPTAKPVVTKHETSKPDDEFNKLYEEIIENTDVTGDLTDPEKVDSEFEEIIHAYDESKTQIPVPRIRQSKIPSLRRKSDVDMEVQKSSSRFSEKSKVRSIPRLKEISMRAKEDNNDVSQVAREYTRTVRTDKISAKRDVESKKDNIKIEANSFVKTGQSSATLNAGEVSLNEQNLDSQITKNESLNKTIRIAHLINSEKLLDNNWLPFDKQVLVGDTDFSNEPKNKSIVEVTKSTKTLSSNATNADNKKLVDDIMKSFDEKGVENLTKIKKEVKIDIARDTLEIGNRKEEEVNIENTEIKNIDTTTKLKNTIRPDVKDQDSNTFTITRTSQINRSVSTGSNNDTATLKKENIIKASVKVGIPEFSKQISESSMGKYTKILQTNQEIKKVTKVGASFDDGKVLPDSDTNSDRAFNENESFHGKSKTITKPKDIFTFPSVSHDLNNNSNNERKDKEYTKTSLTNPLESLTERKTNEVKPQGLSSFTKTDTKNHFIYTPNRISKDVEQRSELESIQTLQIEREIAVPRPQILEIVTGYSKEISAENNTGFEKDNNVLTNVIQKEAAEEEAVELKGKFGRIINKISNTTTLTTADDHRKAFEDELPKKKSILSKIAIFERQEVNGPKPKILNRPENICIHELQEEKPQHVHTPTIVEEVLKPIKSLDSTNFENKESSTPSPSDPFLTYKPLFEHYKSIERIRSFESLNSIEEAKSLQVQTSSPPSPLSPHRKLFENKLDSSSTAIVDAPVILIAPKIGFKKNISLNTDDNKAEFAKTVVSIKETKSVELIKPVQVTVDYEISKIEVESPKSLESTSNADVNSFKDVKKNIAIYENFGNISKNVQRDNSNHSIDSTPDTKLDKDRANYQIKVKNKFHYNATNYSDQSIITKRDVQFENHGPVNNILTRQEITYENIKPITEIVNANDESKFEVNKPANQIKTVLTAKEEVKFNRVRRPVSEILTTGTEIQCETIRPVSQIIISSEDNKSDSSAVVDHATSYNQASETVNRAMFYSKNVDQTELSTNNFSNKTHILDSKSIRHQSMSPGDDIRKDKSNAEFDLGDAVRGKVTREVSRMMSVERFDLDRKEINHSRLLPRMISVSEKIALFERKVSTPTRSDSVVISCTRLKSVKTRPTMQISEQDYQEKLTELKNAKMKYGKWEQMPKITLANGAMMPVLAVGTALLGSRVTAPVVSTAIDLGYRAFDTAFIYNNEKEIGDAIREKIADGTVQREDLFITSKLWSTYHRRDLVEKACRASLDAMGLSYFDLYLIHNPMSLKEGDDPIPKIATVLQYSVHDYLDAWYGMEELVSKGLVKSIGVSNFNSVQIQRILDKGKIKPVVNQVECHPYLSQQRLDTFCAERNIIISSYGVLGSKGTPAEYKSGQLPVIDDPLVQVMASGLNMTPAQLLIRYQIECGRNVVVKTVSGTRLWDNLKSLDSSTLTPGQVDALNALNRNKRNYTFTGMGDTHKNYPFKVPF